MGGIVPNPKQIPYLLRETLDKHERHDPQIAVESTIKYSTYYFLKSSTFLRKKWVWFPNNRNNIHFGANALKKFQIQIIDSI